MKKIEDISRQMPYSESEEYLDALVSRATDKAIEEGKAQKKSFRPLWIASGVAAAAAVLLFVFIGKGFRTGEVNLSHSDGPIDTYLASLSDDELMQLSSYEMEEWEPEDTEYMEEYQ